jgi:peptide/nickel transport system permease protein
MSTVPAGTGRPASGPRIRLRIPAVSRTVSGRVGLGMVAFVVLVAVIGPYVVPHAPNQPIGSGLPGQAPSATALLGTDSIGRDVLSRTLAGGRTILVLSVIATLVTYLLATSIGIVAGYSRSLLDPVLMRAVDVFISLPPLLLLLVLIAGAGASDSIVVISTALVLFPGAARIIRAATLEVSVTGYIEAAVARGESTRAVLIRELFPNIIHVILADAGIRFSASIVLIASLDFLGVGLPQIDDWGVMITQNREVITTNPWGVVAPAIMLGLLTVGINLTADAYARTLGKSD